jgi:DNA (cytosine-5)-methyltransferase 1
MNELHLFAGAGGGILGGILLGHTTVCAVEIEPYPRKVLLQRQRDGILPKFPIWDDVCTFDGIPWRGSVDVLCGGFPCQDISSAGKGAGITGERSGLWKEYARIIGEIRPKFVFAENSPLLRTRGLGVVLEDLASLGYDARWGIIGAGAVGAPHKRDRMWVLAYKSTNSTSFRPQEGNGEQGISFEPKLGPAKQVGSAWASPVKNRWMGLVPSECIRVDDGVAHRVDRLKAIGNGQVPGVAALAWRTLSQ